MHKNALFLLKTCKIAQCSLPPDPQPLAAAPRPAVAYGGWGMGARPQTPAKPFPPPLEKPWLRHWGSVS